MIRQAVASDAAAIAAFWNPQIRDSLVTFNSVEKTPNEIAGDMAAKQGQGHGFWVAEADGKVLGFASYGQFRGGIGYARSMEHTIILGPEARGQGLGRALMEVLLDHARGAGVHMMMAGICAENAGGLRFHEAMGFVSVGRVPEVGYKFGRYLDLVLMQYRL
ncbi:N-acetyltransferase family protein [Roseovarius sp. C7]|uniref:GNAT family N-acetyltransferase n=1 Tax=Roseovarius sp. C7 TaxID=3398643 RepID=UPI0039F7007C